MAQTWPVTRKRLAALRVVDFIGRAATAPFRRPYPTTTLAMPSRILVIEPWNLGDVVLSTAILAELRSRYPQARLSLLAKPLAAQLLHGSPLVDEIITFDLPWTAQRNKYPLGLRILREMTSLVKQLRAGRFDVTVDSRMDIRSNLLAAMTGAPHRVGYEIGGGGWLLTHTLASERKASHKIEDWMDLLDLLPGKSTPSPRRRLPTLTVTQSERDTARQALHSIGAVAKPVIAYHPGGSHPGKRWPRQRFEELISNLQDVGGSHVVFLGPEEKDLDSWPANALVVRPSLRELMAFLTCTDILICNDSGPMHVADALGIPVVAIFEVGNPQWFGPSGPRATVIRGSLAGTGLSAAPRDSTRSSDVTVSCVADEVRRSLRLEV